MRTIQPLETLGEWVWSGEYWRWWEGWEGVKEFEGGREEKGRKRARWRGEEE